MAKSMAPFGPSRCCAMMSSIVMSSLMSMAQLYGMVSFAGSRFTTTVSLLRAVSTCESQKEEERKRGRVGEGPSRGIQELVHRIAKGRLSRARRTDNNLTKRHPHDPQHRRHRQRRQAELGVRVSLI